MHFPPFRYLVAGLGGYAGSHHETLLALESEGLARVVGTCDPVPARFAEKAARWRFAERGVRVYEDYETMLKACAADADVVVLPTPIHLHAPMHRAAVATGLAVYLEKPPTLDPAELEAMIAVDAGARQETLVGFNFIVEPARLELKRRMLAGEFGRPEAVRAFACWPRRAGYFSRNGWAGRLRAPDGRALLDSCLGNAMGHFTHNALHWAGLGGLHDWAMPEAVRAQLARAHATEGADTFLVEARCAGGIDLRIAFTHACDGQPRHEERVECEHATLVYVTGSHSEIRWRGGRVERGELPAFEPLSANHLDYQACLRGEKDRPATRLSDCRPFVWINALAHVSAGRIGSFSDAKLAWAIKPTPAGDDKFVSVSGLESSLEKFLEEKQWLPDAMGRDFSVGDMVGMGDLSRLPGVLLAMERGVNR